MPNWCQNTLSIKGTKEQIVDFNKRYLPNGTFSFENIIPSPQTIEECPEDYIIHNEEEANKHHLGWDPTQPKKAATKKKAIVAAETIDAKCVEVVYSPCNNIDVNKIIWRNQKN